MVEYLSKINGAVTNWTPTDATICAALNVPSIANPEPQPSVPRTLDFTEFLQLFSADHATAIANYPNLDIVLQCFDNQDHAGLLRCIGIFSIIHMISADEATAAKAYVNGTVLDPNWQSQISWAQANIGRPATNDDIWQTRQATEANNGSN